ncbi:MAG TPA: VLRF1 family aeRF1-type release factor [Longimicrobiaceae bacterium]|nr:VLRF1 family aeRF1-type release factor [Longimicrobiaceae bacterium]
MISKHDLERVLLHESDGKEVFSLFLDMSVNSDNKRTHHIFLNQRKAQFDELDSERSSHPREAIGRVFQQVESWLDEGYGEENRGVVIYADLGGDWFEALQFPVTVPNRLVIGDRPAIGPLAQVIESYDHYGVVLLDREHVRILSVYLGTLLDEIEVHGEPYPTRHDIQAGGYSQMRFQRRKLEEMRHFFKEFAKEVEEFVKRYQPEDLIILGTDENVGKFREFLSDQVKERIIFTGPMGVDEPTSEILARIEPHVQAERERESRELVDVLRDRVSQDYLATAGFQSTLTALQEGKVDTLVVTQDQERKGVRCTKCGFVFAREIERCPYDGSPVESGIDVVEAVIRLAEEHGSDVEFVASGELADLAGVGALLRF